MRTISERLKFHIYIIANYYVNVGSISLILVHLYNYITIYNLYFLIIKSESFTSEKNFSMLSIAFHKLLICENFGWMKDTIFNEVK